MTVNHKTAQIVAAAESLEEQGITPTFKLVREKIGGKGSYSTISPVLKAWKEERDAAQMVAAELPESMLMVIERAAAQLWNQANTELGEKVAYMQANHQTDKDQWSAEKVELEGEINTLDNEVNRLHEVVDNLQARLLESAEQLHKTQADLEEARDFAHKVQGQARVDQNTISNLKERVDLLQDGCAKAGHDARTAQAEVVKLTTQADGLQSNLNKVQAEANAAQANSREHEAASQAAEAKALRWQEEAAKHHQLAESAAKKVNELQPQAMADRTTIERLNAQVERLQAALDKAADQTSEAQARTNKLEGMLTAYESMQVAQA